EDAVVPGVREIDRALGVDRDAARAEEIAAPFPHVLPVRVEDLDAPVPGVGDVDLAAGPDRDAAGVLELARRLAPLAPRAERRERRVELLHPVVSEVADVDDALLRHRDAARLAQPARGVLLLL